MPTHRAPAMMLFYFFLGTGPRGAGPAIESATAVPQTSSGWPLAAQSADADWVLSGVPLKQNPAPT